MVNRHFTNRMLERIDDDLWVVETDFSMSGMDFGGRMTVIRLPDGALWLHSVVAIDDALAEALAELGEVKHLVAPNSFHHLFVAAAQERWPDATLYAPRALADKRDDLSIDVILDGDAAPEAWGGAIEMRVMEGAPKIDEAVFFHRASESLLLCDLVFHIHHGGWFSRLMFRMLGVFGRLKQSPLWRFSLTKARAAAEASLRPMWGWDFERVILAHGRIVEGPDAKARLAEGMRWMCGHDAPRMLAASAG